MAKFKQIELKNIKTISIKSRESKVMPAFFGKPIDSKRARFKDFANSLPQILISKDLKTFVKDIAKSHRSKKPIILMLGAHVIKVGLSPLVVDLLKQKIITHIAMNSAASIHDVETAIWGVTSEDVAKNLLDGKFGMSKETGEFINNSLMEGMKNTDAGYGEILGKKINEVKGKFRNVSILAACYKLGIPATVHAAIGTDITHQHPSMNGAVVGELSFRDFKVLINSVKDLSGGGVVMNFGSAVIMPEVFLKALTVARNLGYKAQGFTTGNFDMIRQYRPQVNVVERPTQKHGKGYNFTGHHEIMFPLLCAMIKLEL